jgi:drug/metabolite transporter (DMT)-like permease
MNGYYEKLWNAEKWTLFVCAVGIISILAPEMSNPFKEGLDIAFILRSSASLIMILGFTCMPFFIFFHISKYIGNKKTCLALSMARLIVAILVTLISWWLYYSSKQAIEGDSSSTASLIYAVLPFYILIGGSIIYGILIAIAKNNA